ncbi:unnamed protein product [Meganyctiphanes norvegica]|uniref:Uncharacterized protein n=1 Tax=Meganyctiphanes norvegica TaxID=48144 RepID=A0AAV2QGY0_MEGNR
MQVSTIALILSAATICCPPRGALGMSLDALDPFFQYPETSFTYGKYDDFEYGNALAVDGSYTFFYSIPGKSSRAEERDESGEVEGAYSFVAPEGEEFHFRYTAGEDGYRVKSSALPVPPEDTKEVKKAKEEFFAAYQKALELAGL